MKHMDVIANGFHSHEEIWNLVPDLTPELKQLAIVVLPSMRSYKRLITLIGASAILGTSKEQVSIAAHQLMNVAGKSAREIAIQFANSKQDILISQIVRETQELGNQAKFIATHGVDAAAARSLRGAFRALRNSCTALWEFEYVPEGNPLSGIGAQK
jgi:hypothetical protein